MSDTLWRYCEKFFLELDIFEDINNNSTYKKDFVHAIRNFLSDSTSTEKALEVYEVFSRCYWMINNDDSIIRMIKEMKIFEENAGILTEKQRDHFIHSIYTFLLGLAIYIGNKNYRKYMKCFYSDNSGYHDYYKTNHEEFFYRWGITSLFHDIAYPIEISYNQLKKYLNFISVKCGLTSHSLEANVFIKNTDIFNLLPKMNPKSTYKEEFFKKYPKFIEYDINSLALIAMEISKSFGIDCKKLKNELFKYMDTMKENDFIDHGYYSSLIVLRWFYQLIQNQEWNPVYFYFPILNAATSIILHNYYRHGLMKAPFYLRQLDAEKHPMSYLLILCDEIQDWGRMPYGLKNMGKVYPREIVINLDDNSLKIDYVYNDDKWKGESFALNKYNTIKEILNIKNVFNQIIIK